MKSTYIKFLAAFFLAIATTATTASAEQATITVSGNADVAVTPDQALLTLSVVKAAEEAKAAVEENNEAMTGLTKALLEYGIEQKDMQTSGFSVNPHINNSKISSSGDVYIPQIVGYTVTNSLTLRITDASKTGELLDIAIKQGVNQIGSLQFTHSNPESAIAKARDGAVKNALGKARAIAQSAGVKLGKIVNISESNANVFPSGIETARREDLGPSVPVSQGEMAYGVSVSLVIAVEQ